MNPNKFTLNDRIKSFQYAIEGILLVIKTQHNAWIHLGVTIIIFLTGVFFKISPAQWALLIIAVSFVWVAEVLNTAFELLCDVAYPDFHPLVKKAKDVAAGAVLLSALGSVLIGIIVFAPYILNYL